MPKRAPRRPTPAVVSETDFDDDLDSIEDDVENDENTPINDENALLHTHRSSSLLLLRTPLSHSRVSEDTPLRDITDQFFHPPSPSPIRISKPKHSAPHSTEPPRRPKKPKSLAYPADPPNWLYSRSSSTLPPSSPLPPSTANIDHARLTDPSVDAPQYEYHLGTPSKVSDSDPFGFVAVERALKSKRVRAPKPTPRISAAKSPPRSTVLTSAPSHTYGSLAQLGAPVPTNNEDIEGLYADEPVAGPSRVHAPAAPLLMMNSDQPYSEVDATGSQPTFPDPLRTPRKRRRRASPTLGEVPDSDQEGSSVPSSPSPVKVSVGVRSNRRPDTTRSSDMSALKVTRAQSKAVAAGKPLATQASRNKRVKTSYQDIPTPSSTPATARRSSRQSTAPPTPVPPRRSTRRAVVGAKAEPKTSNNGDDGDGRMKLRSRNVKVTSDTKSTARRKQPSSKSKAQSQGRNTTAPTAAKPTRGRPRGKASAKGSKGKGKARLLENVLDLSDDTRERYDKERRERLEYFKRLEGYQIQKENVYVV